MCEVFAANNDHELYKSDLIETSYIGKQRLLTELSNRKKQNVPRLVEVTVLMVSILSSFLGWFRIF